MKECFFFNDTATTEIYTLSLHDALPISRPPVIVCVHRSAENRPRDTGRPKDHVHITSLRRDRKSTRLNSSHANISYAVFCLKKKTHTHIASSTICTHLCHLLRLSPFPSS